MIFESPEMINNEAIVEFNWVLTRFIIFEVEKLLTSLPVSEMRKVDRLLEFHEKLENFEICQKILVYKKRIQHV